jgi:hypothetical protein
MGSNVLLQVAFLGSALVGLSMKSWFVFFLGLGVSFTSLVLGVASFAELKPIDPKGVRASRRSSLIQLGLFILFLGIIYVVFGRSEG